MIPPIPPAFFAVPVPVALVCEVAAYHGLDPLLVLAIVGQETSDGRLICGPTGNQDWGLMQVNEGTLRAMSSPYNKVPPRALVQDHAIGVAIGCKILRWYLGVASGDIEHTIAMYNGGQNVPWYIATGYTNQSYVDAVLARYEQLKQLQNEHNERQ